jgi:hypothetical protein
MSITFLSYRHAWHIVTAVAWQTTVTATLQHVTGTGIVPNRLNCRLLCSMCAARIKIHMARPMTMRYGNEKSYIQATLC